MVNRFLLELASNSHSPFTVREYGATIRRWQRSGLSPVDYLATLKIKPTTRTMRGIVIRRYLAWAVAQGFESENPLASIRFRAPPVPQVRPFSRPETGALLAACHTELERAVVVCLLRLGLRASELCGIEAGDVLDGTVTIRYGKGGKTRTLAATGLAEALKVIVEAGLSYQQLYRIVKALGRRAGVYPCNPHRCRHTWADACLAAGMSENDLRVLAGWSSFAMLQRYTAYYESERAVAAHRRFLESDLPT